MEGLVGTWATFPGSKSVSGSEDGKVKGVFAQKNLTMQDPVCGDIEQTKHEINSWELGKGRRHEEK